MTDFPPKNAVARFGVTVVQKFEWVSLDAEFNPVVTEARAHPGFSFDDQLDYQSSLAVMQAKAQVDVTQLTKRLDALQARLDAGEATEDEVLAATADETERSLDDERERYKMVVQQTLMLIHPLDRALMEPLLLGGNSTDVRNLRNHLQEMVITRVQREVEAVGGVDPT